ncbi:MAG: NAD(P)-dependent oxidoreductase [candidate division Zixibacteria bacterium]|nr:NAD(P)-dependent oxidoreductase [candidate division Zixibacteria bacterium]
MKRVLLLGASGNIAPHITEGLERYFELTLADVKPHPDGRPIRTVDITDYGQVLEAARGMDAIMNFTVNRPHPVLSFHVSTLGAWHVMRAAAELGIRRVLHTGPELIIGGYNHDFDIDDVPQAPGTGYYGITKHLSMEICKVYARCYDIPTICYQFNGLRGKLDAPVAKQDFPAFTIVWEDLIEACRIAIEIESVPDNFQAFNLHSHLSQGKYSVEKARRMLGYVPKEDVELFYRRA